MPRARLGDAEVFFLDKGPVDAPAVVLGHSLYFDHRMFDELAAALIPEHRVVRYDFRGQGLSSRHDRDALGMDALTDDTVALLEHLGIRRCVYVGNSMGGFVAVRLAARRPDLVAGVIAASSSAAAEDQLERFEALIEHYREAGVGDMVETVLFTMLGDTILADPVRRELVARWRGIIGARGPDIHAAAWNVVHREGVLEELARASVPVVAVAGGEDHAFGVELSRAIAETAPLGRLVVVPTAGHCIALEEPLALVPFIEQLAATLR